MPGEVDDSLVRDLASIRAGVRRLHDGVEQSPTRRDLDRLPGPAIAIIVALVLAVLGGAAAAVTMLAGA